ncbi:MAG: efflux RND transporter periplasmic adaptor subunit [Acidobacteriota bacterium]
MKPRLLQPMLVPWTLAVGAALLMVGCADEAPPPETALRPVKSVVVESGSASIRNRVFSGAAQSAEEAALSFKVSGTVDRVPVEVGDRLKRGDLIAALDRDLFNVELEQALAEEARTKATRRSAEAEYQRVRLLFTNDNASRNELDTALANAESAKASYNAAVQTVRLARLNLGYTRLTASEDCSVAELSVEVSENASAGQTVARVNCGKGWEVVLAVPESLIASFEDGMAGVARFPSVPGRAFEGVVSEVGVGTRDARTFPVTLSLAAVPEDIRSNLAAEVTCQFSGGDSPGGDGSGATSSDRLYVPPSAALEDENGTFVFVVGPSDQPGAAALERRAVEVGEISELGLEVLAGLDVGERIVTAGQIHARDGMLVREPAQ